MSREEKKFEVLPGIKTPDIKTILDAASDENLSEEDFDKLIDNFILKNKK